MFNFELFVLRWLTATRGFCGLGLGLDVPFLCVLCVLCLLLLVSLFVLLLSIIIVLDLLVLSGDLVLSLKL